MEINNYGYNAFIYNKQQANNSKTDEATGTATFQLSDKRIIDELDISGEAYAEYTKNTGFRAHEIRGFKYAARNIFNSITGLDKTKDRIDELNQEVAQALENGASEKDLSFHRFMQNNLQTEYTIYKNSLDDHVARLEHNFTLLENRKSLSVDEARQVMYESLEAEYKHSIVQEYEQALSSMYKPSASYAPGEAGIIIDGAKQLAVLYSLQPPTEPIGELQTAYNNIQKQKEVGYIQEMDSKIEYLSNAYHKARSILGFEDLPGYDKQTTDQIIAQTIQENKEKHLAIAIEKSIELIGLVPETGEELRAIVRAAHNIDDGNEQEISNNPIQLSDKSVASEAVTNITNNFHTQIAINKYATAQSLLDELL